MPFVAIIASRYAVPFELVSGSSVETTGLIAWPSVSVDYANDGETDNPPTRVFVNIPSSSYTASNPSGNGVVVSLPLSNEAVFVREDVEAVPVLKVSVRWINRWRFV